MCIDGTGVDEVSLNRFFQEEEEMQVLTHSDELNRTYSEDNRLTHDTITRENGETRRNRTSSDQDHPTMREITEQGSTSTVCPAFKETTVISSGTKNITVTTAVSPSDSFLVKNTRRCNKERRFSELLTDQMGSKREDMQETKGSHRVARFLCADVLKWRFSEDGEEKKEGEGTAEGTSQLCDSRENERESINLAAPAQGADIGTSGVNPSPTITAWEAGWNVTNAIQVQEYSTHARFSLHEKSRKVTFIATV